MNAMNLKEILSKVDHTLLSPDATAEQIRTLCDQGMHFGTASVCIPPSYVRLARDCVGDRLAVCTVVGFPCGYMTEAVKCAETRDAVENGADEIDMVINIGWVKDGRYDAVLHEIRAVREVCRGKVLKVIVETCLLTDDEKISLCRIVTEAGADYIKTSTGFSHAGANPHDVALMAAHVGEGVGVKAAGGISSLADARALLDAGATRLGTSRIVRLAMEAEAHSESGAS